MRVIPVAVFCLLLTFSFSVCAQTSRGTVSGTVMDSSGAIILGCTVQLTNRDTGVVRTTTTNNAGIYRFDAVDPGIYQIKMGKSGFKSFLYGQFPVEAIRTVTINAPLEPGIADAVVEVTNETLETALIRDSPLRGGTFASDELNKIPFVWWDLFYAGSYPGIVFSPNTGTTATGDFSVNGQRPRANNYMLDGTDNNDVGYGGQAQTFKIIDAIQESFSQTGNFGVEFGRAGGGVFNLITKSGTNEFHGTLSWRFLSQVFDSVDNLRKLNTPAGEEPKKPVYTENIYGFTFGGPIVRNKTFFFAGFQQDSRRSTSSYSFVLPTDDAVTKLKTFFPDNSRLDLYLNAIGSMRGEASPIDVILGRDSISDADRGAVQFATTYLSVPGGYDLPQWTFRLDHNLSDIHRLSFRYTYDQRNSNDVPLFPGYSYDYMFRKQNFLFSDSYTLSPSWTNEFRFSYSRSGYSNHLSSGSVPEAEALPYLSITSVSAPGLSYAIPNFQYVNKWLFQETQTKLAGRHTFRYGLEFVRQLTKRRPPFNERGMLMYQNSTDPLYSAFANYLDDYSGPAGISLRNFGDPVFYPNQFRQSYFFQDIWKLNPSATLTLGLRYENFGTPANVFKYPAFAGFDPSKFLKPNKINLDNNNFGPAFGFAWTPRFESGLLQKLVGDGKTVWRGGFQVSYDAFFDAMLANIQSDSPNSVATYFVSSYLGRGAAGFFSTLPTIARPVTLLDQQTSVLDPNLRSPYTERWSLGFQRDLPLKLLLDLSYVGSVGHKLFTNADVNPRQLDGARPHPDFGIRQIRTNGGNSNYHSMQLRVERRYAKAMWFSASYTWSRMIDSTSEIYSSSATGYSGMALTSVPIGRGGLRIDRGLSDYHRSHTFLVLYAWDIPGPSRGLLKYLAGGWTFSGQTSLYAGAPYSVMNGYDRNNDGVAADRADVGNPRAPLNTRAIISGGCDTGYLNPDTNVCVNLSDVHFVQGTGLPGSKTVGRNTLSTGGYNQTWIQLIKAFPFMDTRKLEFRLESTNIFNHTAYLYPPSASVVGSPAASGGSVSRFLNMAYTPSMNRTMDVQLKLIF
jgi:hypothetical protein